MSIYLSVDPESEINKVICKSLVSQAGFECPLYSAALK